VIYWKIWVKNSLTQTPTLIRYDENFVKETYPDPPEDLPDLYKNSPFPL
jgi:hypothetical protein